MGTVPDLQALLEELDEARDLAFQEGQAGAAVNASVAKAKLLGLLVERRELGVTVHKPGFARDAIELSEDEWKRQFALPAGESAGEAQPSPALKPLQRKG